MQNYPGFAAVGVSVTDNLIAGGVLIETKSVILKAGQGIVPRGAILMEDATTAGTFVKATDPAKAIYVLGEPRDTTAGNIGTVVYMAGAFNSRAMSTGAGTNVAACIPALEARNIYVRGAVAA